MALISRRLAEIDSRSLERELGRSPLIILPIGALEAHGPHLPLGADQIQAEATAASLADRLDGLIAPTIPYGVCPAAREFPGTISLPMTALGSIVEPVLDAFGRMGVRRLLVLSGHAERGHMAALREAAETTMRRHPRLRIAVLSDYELVYELRGTESPATDGHAGLLETSRLLALAPDFVGPERPNIPHGGSPFVPGPPPPKQWPESVVGDTTSASAERGRRIQEHVLTRLTEIVGELLPP